MTSKPTILPLYHVVLLNDAKIGPHFETVTHLTLKKYDTNTILWSISKERQQTTANTIKLSSDLPDDTSQLLENINSWWHISAAGEHKLLGMRKWRPWQNELSAWWCIATAEAHQLQGRPDDTSQLLENINFKECAYGAPLQNELSVWWCITTAGAHQLQGRCIWRPLQNVESSQCFTILDLSGVVWLATLTLVGNQVEIHLCYCSTVIAQYANLQQEKVNKQLPTNLAFI
jgi:hypothetical protein